jgi:hypothetical protein
MLLRFFKLGGGEEFQCESYRIELAIGIFGSGLAFVLAYALFWAMKTLSRSDNYDGLVLANECIT